MTRLAHLASPDTAAAIENAILVIPVGATEQHGPHLPLSTDTDIAVALADGLAARVPRVVVAPPVAYGASDEHRGFPGTLSIGHETAGLLLMHLLRSAAATFPRVLLVNAHGGNTRAVTSAVRRVRDEGHDVAAWSPRWGGDAHAGRTETSVMLALAPHRVHLDRAAAGNTAPLADLMPRLRTEGLRPVTPNGVLGDPAGACAREGDRLLRHAVEDLVAQAVDR
ncbi:mycofactocin biosynthesis peptidyl-dipeptidase MftE [Actinomadura parmotrematis]|uniref:Mycofactocin biosynthesis peptidyl-dipeptidase MftE n=1 Tax=Actinomadura parmotrematis TaxID=2864039 RepID=A0ABS7FQL1_9ACTN|nr:mycofactocin biosynthesis peptidyl-dipeptidase MftE [Actinomadura parmotrematis]MBW8482690.1 mycofactocin biosynthesis peptidyl-dipeptidase MftE [Actinomadura parmotrematis]